MKTQVAALLLALSLPAAAAEPVELSLDDFIARAVQRDTEFEEILVDRLALRYQRDLRLPPRDLVIEVRESLEFSLDDGTIDNDAAIGLSRLFPMTGTNVSARYQIAPGSGGRSDFSSFVASVSQPIAENAFGRSTKLLERIVGLEVDVARHQIVEAYEDYLSLVIGSYLDWYEAYENRRIGRSSFAANQKLLADIRARERSRIALPIDVNKVSLQVLDKEEQLTELETRFESRRNLISTAIRHEGDAAWIPALPVLGRLPQASFEEDFATFRESGRTLAIFRKLETKSSLVVAREADDLLPSIDLLLTFRREGSDPEIRDARNDVLAGVSVAWPVGHQVDEAEHAVAKIELSRAKLATENIRVRLESDLRNLRLELDRERALAKLADRKVALAEAILAAEAENYSFARVTLNDYIRAVNALDTARFAQLRRQVAWRKLLLEWLRLSDQLVTRAEVLG